MVFVYIVRCNFTAPDKEAAWNAWYSGPKIAQMLAKPHFLSCQRFRRVAGTRRDYLALWTVSTPDAFKTPQYLARWGFDEWTPHITDWSRDLFDGGGAAAADFAVAPDAALRVLSFDGLNPDDADAARREIARSQPGVVWLPIAGLDRHTPWIGLQRLTGTTPAPGHGASAPWQQATYRPISDFHTTATDRAPRPRRDPDTGRMP